MSKWPATIDSLVSVGLPLTGYVLRLDNARIIVVVFTWWMAFLKPIEALSTMNSGR